ncbi:MAG: acriflavin resistance protein, partial [uncultured bacterium]
MDRFHRQKTIWQVEDILREGFRQIPGLKSVDVFDYGATPLSSVRAAVDVMVSGPDPGILHGLGQEVKRRLEKAGGLTSVSLSWGNDKKEILFDVDRERCAMYGISPKEIAAQAQTALQGGPASTLRIPGTDGFPVRVRYAEDYRDSLAKIATIRVHTAGGEIPLATLGKLRPVYVPTLLTRQNLINSIDVFGYRSQGALSHIMDNVARELKGIELPTGYTLSQEGDAKLGKASFAALTMALGIGMILLYFSLIPAFQSFIHPLTIMSVIPLALIGAVWSLLITGKTLSTAAFMGVILMAGIVVKNS